jgi:hypothetical protein
MEKEKIIFEDNIECRINDVSFEQIISARHTICTINFETRGISIACHIRNIMACQIDDNSENSSRHNLVKVSVLT